MGGQPGKMITKKNLVYGIDADLILIVISRVALTQATEDSVERLKMDLEQSRKNAAQLKETLKKERDEGYKLKRKFEDMQNEVRTSKAELQNLHANKMTLEVFAERTKKYAHNRLAELQRLQLEYQVLKTEKNDLRVSYETLSVEKDQLQSKIAELES